MRHFCIQLQLLACASLASACTSAHDAARQGDASVVLDAASGERCEGVVTDPDYVITRIPLELADHREQSARCEQARPCNHISPGLPSAIVCRSHAECAAGRNGRCQAAGYECSYDACFTDADCAANQLCDCAGGLDGSHVCIEAHCRTDADCTDGHWCSPTRPVGCYNLTRVSSYRCHTAQDECLTDSDCSGACVFDPQRAHWRCLSGDDQCTVP